MNLQRSNSTDQLPALAVQGLSKRMGSRHVLRDLSFTVAPAERVALLGPSGAGKTTLIRCLTGQLNPDAGEVRLNGKESSAWDKQTRRRIAVVFQQFNLVGRLSALDNVLAGRLGHLPAWRAFLQRFTHEDLVLALRCLDRVGMLEHAEQRADTLSGGQQQRIAIARSLAQQPQVIVADEPIASLDPGNGAAVLELLRDISVHEGVAVVCSLHQADLAQGWANRILGLTVAGPAKEVRAHEFNTEMHVSLYGPSPSLAN